MNTMTVNMTERKFNFDVFFRARLLFVDASIASNISGNNWHFIGIKSVIFFR